MRQALAAAVVMANIVASISLAQEPSIAPVPPPIEVAAAPVRTAASASAATLTQYVIKCQLYTPTSGAEPKLLAAPSIVVTEGHEGHLAIEGERPFVTGVKIGADGSSASPVITRIREGIQAKVTVTALDDEQVLVDAAFTVATINKVEMLQAKNADAPVTESPILSTTGWRTVRTVRVGESIELKEPSKSGESTETLIATIQVDPLGADEAAITPIGAAGKPKDNKPESPVYTVVYSVEDLLAPYTRTVANEELQDSDFVLVMDMILSNALAEWPEGTTMRPITDKRALVISQTQHGHEEIARILRDSRDNVALIEQHLRK